MNKTMYKPRLSVCEMEVLRYIYAGLSSKEIAAVLYRSRNTIDKHRKNMIWKCGVKNIQGVIAMFIEEILK